MEIIGQKVEFATPWFEVVAKRVAGEAGPYYALRMQDYVTIVAFSRERTDLSSDWDSVRHMNVVIGLENEFGIEFGDAELATLTSLPLIVDAVMKHMVG